MKRMYRAPQQLQRAALRQSLGGGGNGTANAASIVRRKTLSPAKPVLASLSSAVGGQGGLAHEELYGTALRNLL